VACRSEAANFEPDYLRIGNYWDALVLAERDIRAASLCSERPERGDTAMRIGTGRVTWPPESRTGLFRHGSHEAAAARLADGFMRQSDVVVRPSEIQRYSWLREN